MCKTNLLREYRGARTMQEMAEKYGVTQQSWMRWEYGDAFPRVTKMARLAEDMKVTFNDLYESIANTRKAITLEGRNPSRGRGSHKREEGQTCLTLVNLKN